MPLSDEDDSEASFNHPIGDVDAVGEPNDVGEWDSGGRLSSLCGAEASFSYLSLARLSNREILGQQPTSIDEYGRFSPTSSCSMNMHRNAKNGKTPHSPSLAAECGVVRV